MGRKLCHQNAIRRKPIKVHNEEELVKINVCGMVYETLGTCLEKFPSTLLGDKNLRKSYFVPYKKAYFFDRHRASFEAILYYYQSGGVLLLPSNVPIDLFEKEVNFFKIPKTALETFKKNEGYMPECADNQVDELSNMQWKWQRKIWEVMEYPESSMLGRFVTLFTVLVILVSIGIFCLETIPAFHTTMHQIGPRSHCHERNSTNSSTDGCTRTEIYYRHVSQIFTRLELASIIWFTIEYLIRFLSSPNKWKFFIGPLNIIDLVAILPYYFILGIESKYGSSLAVIRVFKLSRHFLGLKVLFKTIKASLNEMLMLAVLFSFCLIVFASAMYYAEHVENEHVFPSIPGSFWYCLVTMTTVGYGDKIPITIPGKLMGSVGAILGVLIIAMTVPVFSTNFEFFYKRDQLQYLSKQKEQKEREILEQEEGNSSELQDEKFSEQQEGEFSEGNLSEQQQQEGTLSEEQVRKLLEQQQGRFTEQQEGRFTEQ